MTDDALTCLGDPIGAPPLAILSALQRVAAATAGGDTATTIAAAESSIGDLVPGAVAHVTRAITTVGRDDAPALEVPIVVDAARWGAVRVVTEPPTRLTVTEVRAIRVLVDLLAPCFAYVAALERLGELVAIDALTGFPNGNALHEKIAAEMERTGRYGRSLALVRLDVDAFDDRADGPDADAIVVAVAERLASLTRGGELIARIGPGSFAWLLPETDSAGGQAAADRARRVVSTRNPRAQNVTMSAGVCDSLAADTPADLLALADEAVRRARRRGGDLTIRAAGRATGAVRP